MNKITSLKLLFKKSVFAKNSIFNNEGINMARKRKFHKQYDLAHSIMYGEFPDLYTRTIGVPGKFVKKINRKVHLKDGTIGEMDSAYIADPDGVILKERVAVGLEHLSGLIRESKLKKLGHYDTQLVVDEHLPTFLVIASRLKPSEAKSLIRSPSDITIPYFLDLGEENITQRLKRVSRIINNNKKLSSEDALNLGVIVLYAPPNRDCEITETVVKLYLKIVKDLDFKMEYVLYSVISLMIDVYFDDEKEYVRLSDMMDNGTSSDSIERLASQDFLIESLNDAIENLQIASEQLDRTRGELDDAHGELDRTRGELDDAHGELDRAHDRIFTLEQEVLFLKNQLAGK